MARRVNTSARWLLPILEINGLDMNSECVENTYLWESNTTDESQNQFLVLFKDEQKPEEIKHSDRLIRCEQLPTGELCRFSTEGVEDAVEEIKEGRYSKIPKPFAERYYRPNGKLTAAIQIVEKRPEAFAYWAARGVEIPPEQEVWDKPLKGHETFTYEFLG